MASIGDLVINLRANNAHFQKGINQAQSSVKRFGRVAASALTGGVVAGVAGAVGGIAILRSQMQDLDEVAKLATRTGFDPATIAGFGFAAEQSGSSVAQAHKALEQFTRRMGDAADGSGAAATTLAALGLSVNDMLAMRPEQQLAQVAEAISQLPTEAQRADAAYQLFGRSGMELVNVLATGQDGIQAFQAEADRLGLGFSAEELAQVEAANDAMNRIQRAVGAIAASIAVKLAPSIEWIATAMQSSSESVGGFGQATSTVIEWLQTAWRTTTNGLAMGITAAMATGEWAFSNFQTIAEYTFTEASRLAVQFAGVVAHFFTGTLPALFSWFGENWHSVFFTAFDFVATGFINVGQNIRNVWSAILDFITGSSDGLNFTWTPLLDGFRNTISQLPDLPEREMGELERQLTVDSERLGSQLATSFDDTVGERLRVLAEMQQQAVAAAPEVPTVPSPGVSPIDMETQLAQDRELDRINSGIGQPEKFAGLAERGSAEAFKIIANAGKDQKLLKESQKQTKKLEEIAKNTKNRDAPVLEVQGPV